MRLGLTLSLLLHGGFIAWALLAMLWTEPLKPPEPEPIMVALVSPSEFLALKKGSETSTELEAKANEEAKPDDQSKVQADSKPILAPEPAPEPEPQPKETKVEPPPPPPEPKSDPIAEKLATLPPDPPPGPTPEELKAEAERKAAEEKKQAEAEAKKKAEAEAKKKAEAEKKKQAEAKKKAEEKRKADAQKKKLAEQKRKEAEKKKKQQQADRLAALLDKDPTRKGASNYATEPMSPTDYTGPTAGAQMGDAPVLSVREQDLLRAQISAQLRGCWKLPGGGGGIETTVVTLRWRLRPDGSLDGEPMIEGARPGMVFQIAAEAAIRAVRMCSPFQLPPDKYWAWRSLTWDFDPREML